jgi:hypothetical protein
VTKFLISIPVSEPTLAPEDRLPNTTLRSSQGPGFMPLSASGVSVPRMHELIHLDFESDAAWDASEQRARP